MTMVAASGPASPVFLTLFHYFWALFVLIGIYNSAVVWWHIRGLIARHPDLATGYRRYAAGYSVFSVSLWLIVGAGIELGGLPSVFSFLDWHSGNPYVIAFYTWNTVQLTLVCGWILLGGGAEFLITHQGLMRNLPKNPAGIRFFAGFMLLAWLTVLVLGWMNLLPFPTISVIVPR